MAYNKKSYYLGWAAESGMNFNLRNDVIHREFDRSKMNIRVIIGHLSPIKSKNLVN